MFQRFILVTYSVSVNRIVKFAVEALLNFLEYKHVFILKKGSNKILS
jgi:hypothetical protein